MTFTEFLLWIFWPPLIGALVALVWDRWETRVVRESVREKRDELREREARVKNRENGVRVREEYLAAAQHAFGREMRQAASVLRDEQASVSEKLEVLDWDDPPRMGQAAMETDATRQIPVIE